LLLTVANTPIAFVTFATPISVLPVAAESGVSRVG
jgi:hypothetical protein